MVNCSSVRTVTGRDTLSISEPRLRPPTSRSALAGEGETSLTPKRHPSVREPAAVGCDAILALTRKTDGTVDTLWQ